MELAIASDVLAAEKQAALGLLYMVKKTIHRTTTHQVVTTVELTIKINVCQIMSISLLLLSNHKLRKVGKCTLLEPGSVSD